MTTTQKKLILTGTSGKVKDGGITKVQGQTILKILNGAQPGGFCQTISNQNNSQ